MSQRIEIPGFGAVPQGSTEDSHLGALLGLAVGDALGTTFEFDRIEQAPYPALATAPATDVTGGGPFGLAAGQVTDDTQLAVCLARSLAERGAFDPEDLGTRYVAWRSHAFDVGNQTAASLDRIAKGTPALEAGRAVWHASGRRAAGNGSLMRCAPIGVWFARDREALLDASIADSLITHADPRCALACAVFNLAIANPGEPVRSGKSQVQIARAAIGEASIRLRTALQADTDVDTGLALTDASLDLFRDFDAALADDPDVYSSELHIHRTAGFVRVAFRLAFWHAWHGTPWRDAIVDVASRGGDADTNAAIVGALLGARDGVTAIPRPWLDRVLGVSQPGPPEWADAHHPKHFLGFVQAAARR